MSVNQSFKRQISLLKKDEKTTISQSSDKAARVEQLKKEIDITEHKISLDELYRKYNTNPQTGISVQQAEELLKTYGPNKLTPPKAIPEWVKLLKQMTSGFAILLWLGAFLSIITYIIDYSQSGQQASKQDIWLAVVLAIVVVGTGFFQYFQESRGGKIMESFNKMLPQQAIVLRDGKKEHIPAEHLVIGDIVHIEIGNRIPADVRIISNSGLKVDNSSLTGEAEPQSRSTECTHDNPLETKNLAFFSTFAVEGRAIGVVIKTGDETAMGRIAKLTSSMSIATTHLAEELNHFIHIVVAAALTFGILFFIVSIAIGYRFLYSFVLLISVVVAMVPESLRACLTVSLTLTAKRMAKKNCLVKNLEAIESLGSIGVICSDKTGTLTMNRMTVSHTWLDNSIINIDLNQPKESVHRYETSNEQNETSQAKGSISKGKIFETEKSECWKNLIRCAILCNRAEFKSDPENMAKEVLKRVCVGDGSETALLQYSEFITGSVNKYRHDFEKVFEIPFNSTNKYQLSVHKIPTDPNNRLLVMKGAPERILDHCTKILINEQELELNDEWRRLFNEAYETLGGLGERVLGFCDLLLSNEEYPADFKFDDENPEKAFPPRTLRFLGFVSMIDPPKPNVIEAIAKCHTAGIKVFMVTGDHPITAKAIAKAVGIIKGDTKEDRAKLLNIPVNQVDTKDLKAAVINGGELAQMSKIELINLIRKNDEIVFARTSPQQKLLIVEACQDTGVLVGVTGDGVNDSPAMRKANIGISMGITGSEVSKQVADMILLDDNFATIVAGIEEGRLVFDNISKIIQYSFTKNMAQLSPLILSVITSIPVPVTAITILCVDLGTDVMPSLSLTYEKPEKGIMKRKPRDPLKQRMTNTRLVSLCYGQTGLIEAASGFFCYFVCLANNGFWPSRLLGLRPYWDSRHINDLRDSYGGEWTYDQRRILEKSFHAAFYVGIVVSQIANLISCKTKHYSVFQHGMRNMVLNIVILVNIGLACLLIYTPGLSYGLGFHSITFLQWLPSIPFALYLFTYSEIIKLLARKYPNGFIAKEVIV